MKIVSFLCIFLIPGWASGQYLENNIDTVSHVKPIIDSIAYKSWPSVDGGRISNNGKFAAYVMRNIPVDSYTMVLKECSGPWVMHIADLSSIQFSADSKFAVFLGKDDTLSIIKLGSSCWRKIPNVSSWQMPTGGSGEWIVYTKTEDKELVILNLQTGKEDRNQLAVPFLLNDTGTVLILDRKEGEESRGNHALEWVDLRTMKRKIIWRGQRRIGNLIMDRYSKAVAFLVYEKGGEKAIAYYKKGNKEAEILLRDSIGLIVNKQKIEQLGKFSDNGKYLSFLSVENEPVDTTIANIGRHTTVNIWSYLDESLQSQQLKKEGISPVVYSKTIDLIDRNVSQLTSINERIVGSNEDNGVYLTVRTTGNGDGTERNWNIKSQLRYYIKSVKDGKQTELKCYDHPMIWLSQGGRFVIYYDNESSGYICYEVASGIYRSIAKGLPVSWIDEYKEEVWNSPRGVAGWLKNDSRVLLYDKFDVWLVDPMNVEKSVNITNGYGYRNKIVFNLALQEDGIKPIDYNRELILNALDFKTIENGFFSKKISQNGDPRKLTMGAYTYKLIKNPYVYSNVSYPLKAKNSNVWMMTRMNAIEFPNYFVTRNFKEFTVLSDLHPQSKYNWLTAELFTWEMDSGKSMQGVLYKPENFDPRKKYPVIFHYYEKKSFCLNEYLSPDYISGWCNINIPTFVSSGYLVFCPDIDYTIGDPMQGVVNSVTSAAKKLSNLPFVDSRRMGVGGCSFGGIQTNYLVAHTNLFAAAYSASSMSDFVSAYGENSGVGSSLQDYFETGGQGRMGGTLWDMPEMYIKNSAIFSINKISTPLLIMHTTDDAICPFSQAVELFNGLRRLGKRVWLLEYTDGNHGVSGQSAIDFGVRLGQFFDHYLKYKPAPNWMIRGVPAQMKGIDSGLDLNNDSMTPASGLLKVNDEAKLK